MADVFGFEGMECVGVAGGAIFVGELFGGELFGGEAARGIVPGDDRAVACVTDGCDMGALTGRAGTGNAAGSELAEAPPPAPLEIAK